MPANDSLATISHFLLDIIFLSFHIYIEEYRFLLDLSIIIETIIERAVLPSGTSTETLDAIELIRIEEELGDVATYGYTKLR